MHPSLFTPDAPPAEEREPISAALLERRTMEPVIGADGVPEGATLATCPNDHVVMTSVRSVTKDGARCWGHGCGEPLRAITRPEADRIATRVRMDHALGVHR